ncbi:hypothetical protein GH733_016582 [Mirounga leonina]|nr:hypothetical protein GH733_016582 [Mirounga leonina]
MWWRSQYQYLGILAEGGTLLPTVYRPSICGTLHSVDQYLNIKLTDISVTDPEKYPHMVSW